MLGYIKAKIAVWKASRFQSNFFRKHKQNGMACLTMVDGSKMLFAQEDVPVLLRGFGIGR
jgi:hypothetical protein